MENVEGLLDEKNNKELFDAIKEADKKYVVLPPIVVDALSLERLPNVSGW